MATIIFDFDGTIADSLPLVLEIYKEILPGSPEITSEKMHALRKLPVQKIAAELGVSMWKVPWLLRSGRRKMHDRIEDVKPFSGMPEVLSELQSRGYTMRIVSSNSTENVKLFLRKYDLEQYFVEVRGKTGMLGKTKVLKKVLKKAKLIPNETCYIGDEARDVIGAQRAGMPVVAVTWGFNDIQILSDLAPSKLANRPEDLLEFFTETGPKL